MPCRVRYQGTLPRELSGLNELGIVGSSCWCTLLCSVIKHYLFLALSEVWPQTFQSALCPILPTLQPTEPGSGCPLWTLKHLKQKFKTKLVVTDIALFLWATSSPPSSVSGISLHLLKGPGAPSYHTRHPHSVNCQSLRRPPWYFSGQADSCSLSQPSWWNLLSS